MSSTIGRVLTASCLVVLVAVLPLSAGTFTFVEGGTTPVLGGTYGGAEDCNINSIYANENVGQRADFEVGNNGAGNIVREVMRWDLSALAGYTISTARMDFKVKQARTGAGANTINAYQIFPTDWVEGTGSGVSGTPGADDRGVTWNRRNQTNHSPLTGLAWAAGGLQAGTDRGTTVLGSYAVAGTETAGANTTFTFNPAGTAVLTGWANAQPNGGLLLQATNESTPSVIFHSSQAAQADHPVLTVNAYKPLVNVPLGLELWLDAADPATVSTSGSSVDSWLDKSAKARTATSGTAKPTLVTAGLNNLPAIRFNRGQLTITGGLDIGADQQRTIFAVVQYSTLTGNSELIGTSTSQMVDLGTWHASDAGSTRNERLRFRNEPLGNTWSAAGSVPRNVGNILALQALPTSTLAWRNGAALTLSPSPGKYLHWDMGVGNGVNLGIGGAFFPGREYVGDLSEVLVFDRVLSAGDLNDVGIYLQDKYGLTGSYLPNTAPTPLSGGPYTLMEGRIVTLDASGSFDTDFDALTQFAWDLDNDGQFDDFASAGPAASFHFADLLGLGLQIGSNPIHLRVTDDDGMSAIASTALTLQVPEPASLSLLALAAGGIGGYLRRRQRRA